MKIVEPVFKFRTATDHTLTPTDGIGMLKMIEQMARISHRSEDLQTTDTWQRFIKNVILDRGDWSVAEHASMTAVIRIDRGVTHEMVRHRLFSITQESTRFCRYKEGLEFVYPISAPEDGLGWDADWINGMIASESLYARLLGKGWTPQAARSVLPNALASTIAVTCNLRNWRHFFLMRTSKETHPDFRRISIPMLVEAQRLVPMLFDDIGPMQRQIDNMRKPR